MDKLTDFKPGPLDFYRKQASFDWKKLKVFLDTEEGVTCQHEIIEELQKLAAFSPIDSTTTLPLDEERRLTWAQVFALQTLKSFSFSSNLKMRVLCVRIFILFPSPFLKYSVGYLLFANSIFTMGTERHRHYIQDTFNSKIFGCFCLTEIGHGSNAKCMRTTATYDKRKKVFIINTPDFEAAKCWVGGLGQMATHAVVYAQLILDGRSYGLHQFVVPIRDPKTILPYPGVTVGDMGEKIGLNGVDNGFVMFNNYEIPYENLLNKLGDVSEDGQYSTPFKDPNKRHGAALGALSGGRTVITQFGEAMGIEALTIAIRYGAVRKQFGPDDDTELPVLEYQTHQNRLLPYLATSYVLRIFNGMFVEAYYSFLTDSAFGNNRETLPERGVEIHVVSSASKSVSGWIIKEAVQEAREACGGHGYLKVARLGDIRNNFDANLTYEGENHVLIQQASNWLVKLWPLIQNRKLITTPLKSADFLSHGLDILQTKFKPKTFNEMCVPENILAIYEWLVCYLLKSTYEKQENDIRSGKIEFWARNDSQVYYAKSLAMAYIQHFYLQVMLDKIREASDWQIKNVLSKLFALFGIWSLERHIGTLYKGEYAVGPLPATLIHESVLKLCASIKNDAVSLIDAIAPPDYFLNSVLGNSDGEVYKHLESALLSSPHAMVRPTWWQDVINKKSTFKSKL